jgi:hypothetical protein
VTGLVVAGVVPPAETAEPATVAANKVPDRAIATMARRMV